jgi:hypothetical protein
LAFGSFKLIVKWRKTLDWWTLNRSSIVLVCTYIHTFYSMKIHVLEPGNPFLQFVLIFSFQLSRAYTIDNVNFFKVKYWFFLPLFCYWFIYWHKSSAFLTRYSMRNHDDYEWVSKDV